mgnify:CR=1 FL=1
MTRADRSADRVRRDGAAKRPEGCWYDLVSRRLQPPLRSRSRRRRRRRRSGAIARRRRRRDAARRRRAALRHAIAATFRLARRATRPPRQPHAVPLSPSSAYDEATLRRGSAAAARRGKRRSRAASCDAPAAAVAARHPARRRAPRPRGDTSRAARRISTPRNARRIAEQVLRDPRRCALRRRCSQPGSRAEVPIVGRIARPDRHQLAVAGQIDRLAVTARGRADRRLQDQSPRAPPARARCRRPM